MQRCQVSVTGWLEIVSNECQLGCSLQNFFVIFNSLNDTFYRCFNENFLDNDYKFELFLTQYLYFYLEKFG